LQEHDELYETRLQKLSELRARGIEPFGAERYARTHTAQEILDQFEALEGRAVRIAGRLVERRVMGKASFFRLEDLSGRIQLYFKLDQLGPERYELLDLLDIGDFLGVEGEVFRTRTGEISVAVAQFEVLAKSLRPLPFPKQKEDATWYGLQDVEQRYRQRYADLAVHPDVRAAFVRRSRIVTAMRRFLDGRGFLEVETPVLQSVAGGAAAKPFLTHHNALDYDFHLRISLELYLKRLIVGGFERVYEIGRVFRNEGIDTRHSPEFTMLELYQAYANLDDMMELVEGLIATLANELYGSPTIPGPDGPIDVAPPWRRLPMLEGIRRFADVPESAFVDLASARAAGERLGLDMTREHQVGGIIEKIHERFVQPSLVQPTFITDFPLETSPLAKKRPDNPRLVRRFEGYVACQELSNAFSEINDPLDQRERFQEQLVQRAAGDEEAHPMDEDFLRALEYGMPPTGGLGIGIDRLVMVLTDTASIRDVILFPQMKPER
jgi:lysyl-tRNA synthetase, class II